MSLTMGSISTSDLTKINESWDEIFPCTTITEECNAEAEFLVSKSVCDCIAYMCHKHTQSYIARVVEWHNSVYGSSDYSHCSICRLIFIVPTDVRELYRVTPI